MRQSRLAVYIHFVWTTWDRLPLLTGERQRVVYRAIEHKCRELGAEIIALGGMDDHIHLLLRMPADRSIAELIGQINRDFFKWQGAYGAFSVSPRVLATVSAYTNNQAEHHARGSLIAA